MKKWTTNQEELWSGEFCDEYIKRHGDFPVNSNAAFFSKIFDKRVPPKKILELGSNVGLNLKALRQIIPNAHLSAVEISHTACEDLRKNKTADMVFEQSILDFQPTDKYDLVFTKGVLIHLNPDFLPKVYETMVKATTNYLLVAEYYNPSPVEVEYRNKKGFLFKRDFAGEILSKHPEFSLVDYGFSYRRDPIFPQDDITWFLMQRR